MSRIHKLTRPTTLVGPPSRRAFVRTLTISVAVLISLPVGYLTGEISTPAAIGVIAFLALISATLVLPRTAGKGERVGVDRGALIAAPPWWMSPTWILPLAVTPGVCLAWLVPEATFRALWGTPKYLTGADAVLALLLLLAFVLGAVAAGLLPARASVTHALNKGSATLLRRSILWVYALTVCGYLAQLLIALSRGLTTADVEGVFTGHADVGGLKSTYLAPVAGLTTFGQLGPVAITGLMLLRRLGDKRHTSALIGILFALGLYRAVLYAERLALLELLVPAVVIALAYPRRARARARTHKALVTTLPLWAPALLFLTFGAFEYVRSWSSYYSNIARGSYVEFVSERLGAYYAVATNNSALLLHHDPRIVHAPYFTFEWAWSFPGIGGTLSYERLGGVDFLGAFESLLAIRANPEFNNPGGILLPVFDFGAPAALLFWALLGLAFGLLYSRFVRGTPIALMLFPVAFIGFLESGRFLYWFLGRAFPALVAAVVVGAIVSRGVARDEPAGSAPREPIA